MPTPDEERLDRLMEWMNQRHAFALKQRVLFVKLSPRRYGVVEMGDADSFMLDRTLPTTPPDAHYIVLGGRLVYGPAPYGECKKYLAGSCKDVHPAPAELLRLEEP